MIVPLRTLDTVRNEQTKNSTAIGCLIFLFIRFRYGQNLRQTHQTTPVCPTSSNVQTGSHFDFGGFDFHNGGQSCWYWIAAAHVQGWGIHSFVYK